MITWEPSKLPVSLIDSLGALNYPVFFMAKYILSIAVQGDTYMRLTRNRLTGCFIRFLCMYNIIIMSLYMPLASCKQFLRTPVTSIKVPSCVDDCMGTFKASSFSSR